MNGMNPVRGQEMLNFLNWVAANRPDVQSLTGLSNASLLELANEFELGKLDSDDRLKRQWAISFDYLLKDNADWDGYASIRRQLRRT
jgi:hypothetical protein